MGIPAVCVQSSIMSEAQSHEPSELLIAENILRLIYGDDFKGCTVRLEDVAALIAAGRISGERQTSELLELYEKLLEALDLLSTPPDVKKVSDPNELRSLLSERLDAIHSLTVRTLETVARVKKQQNNDQTTE